MIGVHGGGEKRRFPAQRHKEEGNCAGARSTFFTLLEYVHASCIHTPEACYRE